MEQECLALLATCVQTSQLLVQQWMLNRRTVVFAIARILQRRRFRQSATVLRRILSASVRRKRALLRLHRNAIVSVVTMVYSSSPALHYEHELMALSERSHWMLPRCSEWWERMISSEQDDKCWISLFRMSRSTLMYIAEELRPALQRRDTGMRSHIPVEKRVAMTIWKLAHHDSYKTVSELFGVGISSACSIFEEVCEEINSRLLAQTILLGNPQDIMEGFKDMGFPNCLGAIDAIHISILCPPFSADSYINCKGFYSMVLQALVDSKSRFTDIYVGFPERSHDSRILHNSPFFNSMDEGTFGPQTPTALEGVSMTPVVIGDHAYPLRPWLMKPYPAPKTEAQEKFNDRLAKCRTCVERAFGVLRARWRCLQMRLDVREKLIPVVIATCCILHNICEIKGDELLEPLESPTAADTQSASARPRVPLSEAGLTKRACQIRAAYCSYFEKNPL
ncbi:putative nuclease HARBI1, partial [Ophiophagus hannah]